MRAPLQRLHLDIQPRRLGHGLAEQAHVEHLRVAFIDQHADFFTAITRLFQQAPGLVEVVGVTLVGGGVVIGTGGGDYRVVDHRQTIGQRRNHLRVIQGQRHRSTNTHVLEQRVIGLEQQAADGHDRADLYLQVLDLLELCCVHCRYIRQQVHATRQ